MMPIYLSANKPSMKIIVSLAPTMVMMFCGSPANMLNEIIQNIESQHYTH